MMMMMIMMMVMVMMMVMMLLLPLLLLMVIMMMMVLILLLLMKSKMLILLPRVPNELYQSFLFTADSVPPKQHILKKSDPKMFFISISLYRTWYIPNWNPGPSWIFIHKFFVLNNCAAWMGEDLWGQTLAASELRPSCFFLMNRIGLTNLLGYPHNWKGNLDQSFWSVS